MKKKFPGLYDYYQHIQRRQKIKRINKVKEMSNDELRVYLTQTYENIIGHKLDWNQLETYTEKMQWDKLYNDDPMKAKLADKYAVRSWVSEKIGDEYLIPILGKWKRFEDIDFAELPNEFVLKTNHGSGTNIIVKNKDNFDFKSARKKFKDWMDTDYGYDVGLELHYSKIMRLIIAEKYMETEYGELQDYKFLCFGGKPYYCWVDMGRYSEHTRNVYNLEWEIQPWNQEKYSIYKNPIPKPKNFEKMIEIAEILCEGFHHVRVDLYNVNGQIYFGEMTFTNGRGLDCIVPEKYDKMLGDLWNII